MTLDPRDGAPQPTDETAFPELLPCPCCGSDSVVWSDNFCRVRCNNCFIGTSRNRHSVYEFAKAEAIAAWNRRDGSGPLHEQLRQAKYRTLPDENGEGGETWRAAFADADQSRIAAEDEVAALHERVKELEAQLADERQHVVELNIAHDSEEAALRARLSGYSVMREALDKALPVLLATAESYITSEHPENVGGMTGFWSCKECDYVSHGGETHDPEAECAASWAAYLQVRAALSGVPPQPETSKDGLPNG